MKSLIALSLISLTIQIINKQQIQYLKKNSPFSVYSYEENPFKTYTDTQLKNLLIQVKPSNSLFYKDSSLSSSKKNDFPESYDIRTVWPQCVQKIWNNPSCGSTMLPSVTAFSNRVCISTEGKMTTQLSLQHSISCDPSSPKCQSGGLAYSAWKFYESNGIVDSLCYPFEGVESDCISKCKNGDEWKLYKASRLKSLNTIDLIKEDLYNYGYVETTFNVYSDFFNYKGGIYQHTTGSYQGMHGVVIVGWGVSNGIEYWICQNSWGSVWGEKGSFIIKMGQCNIDSYAFAGIHLK